MQSRRKAAFFFRRVSVKALLCLILMTSSVQGFNETVRVALIMPEASERTRAVYEDISSGVAGSNAANVLTYTFNRSTPDDQLQSWLAKQEAAAVVTIGKAAHELVKNTRTSLPIVVGGMSRPPVGSSGIGLTGDPKEFLDNVRKLAPTVKRVHLIYKESINGWWTEGARTYASELGLQLITIEVDSLKTGAKQYEKLAKQAKTETDAIWIPLVSVVPAKTVLPMVLKRAWDRNIVVFTNSPSHAKQGALFSLYPDNRALGRQLINMAVTHATGEQSEPEVAAVKSLKLAVNWRTAAHLGIKYSPELEADFDKVYPAK